MRAIRKSRSPDDSVTPISIKHVSKEQMLAVAKFLPVFENIKPEDFSKSAPLPENCSYGIGFVEFHPAVYEFINACYENEFVQSYDWTAWGRKARQYMADPSLVASARISTLVKLLTAHIRCERFCDGHLHSQFESGHLTAILRRLEELAHLESGN